MKDNKYYVPDLTEFRVGFRYEVPVYGGNWELHDFEKKVLTDLKDITIELLPYVRCKYLDESDILELGFVKVKETNYQKSLDNENFYEIQYDEDGLVIELWKRKTDTLYDCFTLFRGQVKNYNELEVILKQIGV